MKRLLQLIITAGLLSACSYDEGLDLLQLTVRLVYPENTVQPYEGARVELRSIGRDAVFVDSTDAQGVARFTVTPGIYEASTSSQFLDSAGATWWRYNFNGVRSMIVVSADSLNSIDIELKSSRKRVVH
ncbi:MAG: hypothetical protein IJ841_08205 [Prevotella sp.]|nr:hypothetical protein [Prevotella sp.]